MPSGQRETSVSMPLTPTDLYWRRIFNKYDRDNDGRISYVELKGIIESREYDQDLPDNVVDKIMVLADSDNSGYLDFAEFVAMMHNPDLKAVFGHFVARYIHSIIPHRNPIDTTGTRPRTYVGHQTAVFLMQETTTSNNVYETATPDLPLYGTYEEEYSCWPPAICMILISLVEIVLFCYDAAQGNTQANGPIAQIFIYNPHKRQEAWRFVTYMLVHVGVVHLLVNLLVQLFLGVPLEMVHRWWRVTLVYLAGVAAGSLATSLADPKVYLAGASGGVYALIAAHVATIIMNWAEMEFAIVQLLVFLLLAGVDVGTAVYDRYWRHLDQHIGYVAHLAGAVAGLLVGIGVLRNLEKRKWEKRLWWAAVVLYFALMIAGILANIFWTARFK
ncbi:rhomboid-related protein 2 isoform X2 [Manduca sexta]|uniref:rhomboid-related protein 2 isoform X2 n=1 Tax=Manduca sexta TaxID=7130 RepID=UPI00188E7953|nr:rhomboid-related protein 2 isoform X2 [Manduca sexta]